MDTARMLAINNFDWTVLRLVLKILEPWISVTVLYFLALPTWILSMLAVKALRTKLPPANPSTMKHGMIVFVVCFAGYFLSRILISSFWPKQEPGDGATMSALVQMVLIHSCVCLAAVGHIVYHSGRQGLAEMGFVWVSPRKTLSYALAAYFAFFPVYILFCLLNRALISYEPQELVQRMLDNPEFFGSVFVLLSTAIIIPIFEEILFRGFLLSGLRFFMGSYAAILVSAAVFAFMHEPQAAIPVFAVGCILGYLKERTGSLYSSILGHMVHNSLMLLLIPLF